MSAASQPIILGVVLAGGRSSRMQPAYIGDKFLQVLGGETLLERVIKSLAPQVTELVVTYNGERNRFNIPAEYPLIPDCYEQAQGPVGGILSAFQWSKSAQKHFDYLIVVPADAVGIPLNLVSQLLKSNRSSQYAIVGKDRHYTLSLWTKTALDVALEEFNKGERALRKVLQSAGAEGVHIETEHENPILNINTPEEFEQAKARFKD